LEASEKNMGNRGSKSVTVLSLNHLLIFAHYNFISFKKNRMYFCLFLFFIFIFFFIRPSVPVEVLYRETGIKIIYPSMSEVGEALGVPTGSIRMYFSRNTQKPYKGRYLLQKLKKV